MKLLVALPRLIVSYPRVLGWISERMIMMSVALSNVL